MNLVAYRVQVDPVTSTERSKFGTQALALANRATSIANEAIDVVDGFSTTIKTIAYAPFGKTVTNFINKKKSLLIEVKSQDELSKYSIFGDEGLLVDGLYVGHPTHAYKLLPAESFHRLLEREQISEIIRFVRSELRVKSIRIAHQRGQVSKTKGGVLVDGVPAEISTTIESGHTTIAYFSYDMPALIPLQEELVWKNTYQELVHGLQGAI